MKTIFAVTNIFLLAFAVDASSVREDDLRKDLAELKDLLDDVKGRLESKNDGFEEEEVLSKGRSKSCQCFANGQANEAYCESWKLDIHKCVASDRCHWGPEEDAKCRDEVAELSKGFSPTGEQPYYIESVVNNRFLYAQSWGKMEQGVGASKSKGYDDQKWYFEETSYKGKKAYFIKNAHTGRLLYAQSSGTHYNGFGATTAKGYDDQKWILEKGSYKGKEVFFIKNAYSQRCIFAQSWGKMEDGVGATKSKGYDDQKFVFTRTSVVSKTPTSAPTIEVTRTVPTSTVCETWSTYWGCYFGCASECEQNAWNDFKCCA